MPRSNKPDCVDVLEKVEASTLLPLAIADTFTPLEWENYVPYDRPPS
jgi:hypothetical protein